MYVFSRGDTLGISWLIVSMVLGSYWSVSIFRLYTCNMSNYSSIFIGSYLQCMFSW